MSQKPNSPGKKNRKRNKRKREEAEKILKKAQEISLGNQKVKLIALDSDVNQDIEEYSIVTLNKLHISNLYSTESRLDSEYEGTLELAINGQSTVVEWRGAADSDSPIKLDYDDQVLYVGDASGLLDIQAKLIESDQEELKNIDKVKSVLTMIGRYAGMAAPAYAPVIGAGVGLANALADVLKASIDDDVELHFLGALGGSDVSPELKTGNYMICRENASSSEIDDIQISFTVQKFTPPANDVKRKAVIVLKEMELNLSNVAPLDTLTFDSTMVGPTPKGKKKPITKTVSFDQRLINKKATADLTTGIAGKVLYSGEYGKGIAFSLGISAMRADMDPELKALIQRAGEFVAIIDEDEKDEIAKAVEITEAIRTTALKLNPQKRFAVSRKSVLFASKADANQDLLEPNEQPKGLFAVPADSEWHAVPVKVPISKRYGDVTFHLEVKVDK